MSLIVDERPSRSGSSGTFDPLMVLLGLLIDDKIG